MPIAALCIYIRKLPFQICVSAHFKSIWELIDHLVEDSFKVDWFLEKVQCVIHIRLFCFKALTYSLQRCLIPLFRMYSILGIDANWKKVQKT